MIDSNATTQTGITNPCDFECPLAATHRVRYPDGGEIDVCDEHLRDAIVVGGVHITWFDAPRIGGEGG